jgi:predicted amidohydrolase
MVNRVGLEDEMDFAGETLYAGPSGETIFIADDKEQLIIEDVDLDAAREMRERKPYVSLRRTDLYV